jgi:hypothetical protein
MSQTIISSIRNKEAIIIEIAPKFYATWDHGKEKIDHCFRVRVSVLLSLPKMDGFYTRPSS